MSCSCRDCLRYRQPRSAGVPGHDDTLSVSSQSETSSCLAKRKECVRIYISWFKSVCAHKTTSGFRVSRRHWPVRWLKVSVISTMSDRAVAIAELNRLACASLSTIISGGSRNSVGHTSISAVNKWTMQSPYPERITKQVLDVSCPSEQIIMHIQIACPLGEQCRHRIC